MTHHPRSLMINARASLDDVTANYEYLLDWARQLNLGALRAFVVGDAAWRDGDEAALREHHEVAASQGVVLTWFDAHGLEFAGRTMKIGRRWDLNLRVDTSGPTLASERIRELLEGMEACVAGMLGDLRVLQATVRREGAGLARLPRPSLFGLGSMLLVKRDRLADYHSSVDEVLALAWDLQRESGEHILLGQALGVVDNLEFRRAIQDRQWAITRSCVPNVTRYELAAVSEDEWPIYHAGEPRLETVGYLENERLLELSCVLTQPDQHIQGWEIYNLAEIVQRRQLPDGRPIERVRVVFLERAHALQERRPLLDNGIEVYHMGDDGELVRIDA